MDGVNLEEEMADWSDIEVELIIEDYFQMLQKELTGQEYNKTEHRNRLIKLLNNRSDGSIEFKHQNISAALINLGSPYIKGYKPRWNYQQLLEVKIQEYLQRHNKFENIFDAFALQKIKAPPKKVKFEDWIVSPPEFQPIVKEPIPTYKPVKKNYLEIEQHNASIGHSGEELVFEYEKWRLKTAGKENLAESVEWSSKNIGDGLGYDIHSYKDDGKDMFIEVKTTKLGKETPIFFSKREYDFANDNQNKFHLYRVFDLNNQAKMFQRNGKYDEFCAVQAVAFKGMF